MATTKQNFVQYTNAGLVGSTVQAAGQVVAVDPGTLHDVVTNNAGGTAIDKLGFDFSADGYAAHGAGGLTFSGTTPITIDLTNISGAATVSTGDNLSSALNTLVVQNTGAADITLAPGGSNPVSFMSGTTPTITVAAGGAIALSWPAGLTISSSHKTLLFTPTSGGSAVFAVAGA
jgi:hypothetical protein